MHVVTIAIKFAKSGLFDYLQHLKPSYFKPLKMPFADINQTSLYYEIHGTGAPVLFIHGLGSSAADWELQVDFFAQHYQVILVDLRGHGQSSRPSVGYSIPQFATDTQALLQHLGYQRVHLVGISLGGMIGFQLAVTAPSLLQSLVVLNSVPYIRLTTLKQKWQLTLRKLFTQILSMRSFAKILARKLFPEPSQAHLRKQLVERWVKNDKKIYYQSFMSIFKWQGVQNQLPNIACPVLVLAADMDYLPVSHKQAYAQQIPQAQLEIIHNSRHASIQDQPDIFNQKLHQFLQANTITPA